MYRTLQIFDFEIFHQTTSSGLIRGLPGLFTIFLGILLFSWVFYYFPGLFTIFCEFSHVYSKSKINTPNTWGVKIGNF